MPAPAAAFYETAAKTSLSTELLSLLTGGCYVKIFSNVDVLLAQIFLVTPPGQVQSDGSLAIYPLAPDDSANASGVAAYMELYNGSDVRFLTMPIIEGVSPALGYMVMTSTTIVSGLPVAITGFTLG